MVTVRIPAAERDATLPERLKAEWPGILAWLVQGCLEWQRNGLQPPLAVQAATAEYIDGEDVLATWLEERCDRATDAWASRDDLFGSWSIWANSAREVVGTQKQFYQLMRSHEFEEGDGPKGSRGFKGVKVKPVPVWSGAVAAPRAPLPPLPY
jgi:putative DNA primase/helicase